MVQTETALKTSDQGLLLLMEREGMRNAAYLDSEGIVTIGVGHVSPDVKMGDVWTDEQVRNALRSDIGWAEVAVNGCVKVPLTFYQFDALVSFTFECGSNALPKGDHGGPCSILRALNAGDYAGAANAFHNWCNPPEITSRRMGEMEQFKGTKFAARIEGETANV